MTQHGNTEAPLHSWLCDPLPADVRKALSRLQATEDVCHVAVMPDVHLARDVCIGTVVATSRSILPQAVGSDIGCGMAAIAFDCEATVLDDEEAAGRLLAGLHEAVPVMRQPRAGMLDCLPDPLQESALSSPLLEKLKPRDARVQLGTLGRGNHFLEFQSDQEGRLWLMVHSGSRAVGQAIAWHHLSKARTTSTGLACLDAESPDGQAYLSDIEWARSYASWNRRLITTAATGVIHRLFGAEAIESSRLECDHNHLCRETHFGRPLWVHRKGAIQASEGELGIIPGSMGTGSFHVEGRGRPESLCSSSHGAGRSISRDQARRRVSVRALERQMADVWFNHRAAEALREEAPAAYKDIEAVLRAQRELTRVLRRLRPVLSYKGV